MNTAGKKPIAIIAALQSDRGLGYKGELLFRIPDDLKRFQKLTTGNSVIMGKTTFESIGKALPNRKNIVLTFDPEETFEGAFAAHSLEEAIELADQGKIFVIGGAQVYALALPYAAKLHLTLIERKKPADAFFPDYSEFAKKTLIEKREYDGIPYSFVDFERKN